MYFMLQFIFIYTKGFLKMKKLSGSCHCGHVRFQIESNFENLIQCNCSVCHKKNALMHRVPKENFKLLSGEDSITCYQFNTKKAEHNFCSHCGIYVYHKPRTKPDMLVVNACCLDDMDQAELYAMPIEKVDGKSYS